MASIADQRTRLDVAPVCAALAVPRATYYQRHKPKALVRTPPRQVPRALLEEERWLAAALLDLEPRLRRIRGFRVLPVLRQALQAEPSGTMRMTGTQAA